MSPVRCRPAKCPVIVAVVAVVDGIVVDIVPDVEGVLRVAAVLRGLDGERVCGGDELRLQRQTGCTTSHLRTYFKSSNRREFCCW